jgi:hypothetical protein
VLCGPTVAADEGLTAGTRPHYASKERSPFVRGLLALDRPFVSRSRSQCLVTLGTVAAWGKAA